MVTRAIHPLWPSEHLRIVVTPTLDLKPLQLPEGMSIYPCATGVNASAVGGAGVKSLSFHTRDSIDKVMAYYNAQLTMAG